MILPEPLIAFVHRNSDDLVAASCLLILVLILTLVLLSIRLGRLNRLYRRLTRGTSGGNLEEALNGFMGTVDEVSTISRSLRERLDGVADRQRSCLQGVGVVRFDAFEEVGGEQSFAVVVLDADRSGLALSSVYSRSDVRVYAKHINGGQPSHPLTEEEQRAMARAEGRLGG